MNIYLAYPIDQRATNPAGHDKVIGWVRTAERRLREDEFSWYDPGAAFCMSGEVTTWVQDVNQHVLHSADAVLALLPAGVPSVGVPMEVQLAHLLDKPVAVVHDHLSYTLMGLGVPVFTEIKDAVAYLASVPEPDPAIGYNVKVAGSGQFDRAYEDDAGFDLTYHGDKRIRVKPGEVVDLPASVQVEWPDDMFALLIGRSSTFKKRGLLVNPSIIDAGYRGDMFVIVRNVSNQAQWISPGERLAQMVPFPTHAAGMGVARVHEDELTPTDRGANGFGSSGA